MGLLIGQLTLPTESLLFKSHPSLFPLVACVGAGVGWCTFYVARLALHSPDVRWQNKRSDSVGNVNWPINKPHKFQLFDTRAGKYKDMKFPEERPNIEKMWTEYKRTQG